MRSLRSRLILSHTLPLLLLLPLLGIALILVLERQVLLANLSAQLIDQADLIADAAQDYPQIWRDTAAATTFANRFNDDISAQVMLVTADGRLWVSSSAADAPLQGQPIVHPGLAQPQAAQPSVYIRYSNDPAAEVADVLVPVIGRAQQVVGIVRLTQELAPIYQRFQRLRSLVGWVLIPGLVVGMVVGLSLATVLKQPLDQLAAAMRRMRQEDQWTTLAEQGPAEIQSVARSFNLLVERLHSLEATRRQLLANVVHEIGRPLGALLSATRALEQGAFHDEELRPLLLHGMETELHRLKHLLDDLAELHDQVLKPLRLERQLTALGAWLPGVLGPWRQAAEEKGLVWQAEIAPDLPILAIDTHRLGQAVGNLLSNAIKYTLPGGRVTVRAERVSEPVSEWVSGPEAEAVCIWVSDSGCGIAPEEQERIFAPFYRAQTDKRFPQGMGLGLTIARDLVAAHGGQLTVESTPGQGSRFLLRLPLAAGAPGP